MVAVSVGRFLLKLYFWTPPGPHVYSHPFMPSSWLTRHHSESCSCKVGKPNYVWSACETDHWQPNKCLIYYWMSRNWHHPRTTPSHGHGSNISSRTYSQLRRLLSHHYHTLVPVLQTMEHRCNHVSCLCFPPVAGCWGKCNCLVW